MVSHAAFPDVSEFLQAWFRRTDDPPTIEGLHRFPATISGNVLMRLLRVILKYDGLVITDDMEMGAVVQTLSVAEASLRALLSDFASCHTTTTNDEDGVAVAIEKFIL